LLVTGVAAVVLVVRAQERAHEGRPAAASPPPVAVTTQAATRGDVSVYLTALGAVTPLNTVTVKSRVDGQLVSVPFKEGDVVQAGDLLAEIDPRPFQVQLTQAEGQMARDQALLDNARADLERYRILLAEDSIARQQVDTQQALVHQYEGAIKVDQGQIASARLRLDYCRITAPIGGQVGLRLVDAGNMVHATDPGGLVVITQLVPITAVFAIPEDSLPRVLARWRAGARLPVEAYDRALKQRLAVGALTTIDNQIDPATGTVKLKAEFANAGHELFPKQFVNARLLLDVQRGATLVPAAAVQRGTQGSFVYVVKPDGTAAVRPVKAGTEQGDDVSIETGLAPGELVVVEGADRLRDGSRVDARGSQHAGASHS